MGEAHLVGIAAQILDELRQAVGGKALPGHDHHGPAGAARNRLEVIHRAVGQALEHGAVGGVTHVNHQERVAIRL